MKTRDAKTIQELTEIFITAAEAENALTPAWNRAFRYHDGNQSRHFRKIARAVVHQIARWTAASKRMQEMERKMNPGYVF